MEEPKNDGETTKLNSQEGNLNNDDGYKELVPNGKLFKKVMKRGNSALSISDTRVIVSIKSKNINVEAKEMVIGYGFHLPAYEIVLKTMCEGETAHVKGDYELVVNPNGLDECFDDCDSTFEFEIVVNEVKSGENYEAWSDLEKRDFNTRIRETGKSWFKIGKFKEAGDVYKKYTQLFEGHQDDPNLREDYAKIYNNLSIIHFNLGEFKDAKILNRKCLDVDDKYCVGWYRKAVIEKHFKEYDEAAKSFEKGLEIEPGNKLLIRERESTLALLKEMREKERQVSKRMLKGIEDVKSQTNKSYFEIGKVGLLAIIILAIAFLIQFLITYFNKFNQIKSL
uniref:TPR_REGION domain-containing protein n=1 Tax=Rhabditophanes sp. KR3021 TaxID=114890 RepID=A0AC35TGG8_9BILA